MPIILKCFLSVTPTALFYDFVKQLPDLNNTCICIDDNKYNIPYFDNKVNIIKVNEAECIKHGFHSSLVGLLGNKNWFGKAGSRDKALYFFYKNKIKYDYIWFLEEDVFIPTIDTIQNIDNKYNDYDLLSSAHGIYKNLNKTDWPHWNTVCSQLKNKIQLPYAISAICAIRCSKKLLECIFAHAVKFNSLFFDEAMFNTVALHNNLNVKAIQELSSIVWRKKNGWQSHEINKNNLYHPVKCIKKQYMLRDSII